MSQSLRLPKQWTTLSSYRKMTYLIDTRQARNFTHAAVILNDRKTELKEEKKQRNQLAFQSASLPYKDN